MQFQKLTDMQLSFQAKCLAISLSGNIKLKILFIPSDDLNELWLVITFSVQQISASNVAFAPKRDWILCDACFAGSVPVATCDVSVVCCRQFPVDCAIVVLAEELKNRLFLWSFHCFEDIFTFFVCFLPFTWLTKADFHYIQVDAFLAGKAERFVWILVVFPQP